MQGLHTPMRLSPGETARLLIEDGLAMREVGEDGALVAALIALAHRRDLRLSRLSFDFEAIRLAAAAPLPLAA